jgi:hypothetical protein
MLVEQSDKIAVAEMAVRMANEAADVWVAKTVKAWADLMVFVTVEVLAASWVLIVAA